jgi:tetratricopeptide (TPR) repeat protein
VGAAPVVFVSYSHKDEVWMRRLLPQLEALRMAGAELDVWTDRDIRPGVDWYAAIRQALDRTRFAVCLVSENFLSSPFCIHEEVEYLRQRRDRWDLEILPVLLTDCVWDQHRWLRRLQLVDARPLDSLSKANRNRVFAGLARTIAGALDGTRPIARPPVGMPPADRVDVTRLPQTDDLLLGRRAELDALDADWADPARRVVVLHAPGGAGKSALLRVWTESLAQDGYRGARRVFAWSFYSQGTGDAARRERVASADLFIATALAFFGDPDPTAGTPWDKGERLAGLVARERALLLLDGMEPLQSPGGGIKDPSLRTLLEGLARKNPGLCMITSREPVSDLGESAQVRAVPLERLSPLAGRALLRIAGVEGDDEALEAAVTGLDGHALAIRLLGTWLATFGDRHIRHAAHLAGPFPTERLLAAWTATLEARGDRAAVQLLHVLGLFDRPADAAALAALCAPPIPGLTDHLDAGALPDALDRLRAEALVARQSTHAPDEIDAHPLVREYFAARLQTDAHAAWTEAHLRLYRHFAAAAPDLPDTLDEIEPLFRAVVHGCVAGRHQEALVEVYWRRIQHGNDQFLNDKLGAFAADLATLAHFFAEPWTRPAPSLSAPVQALVLNFAGFALRALGRLAEAVAPMEAGLARRITQEDWENAALDAGNLSELHLALGALDAAEARAREAVAHADRSGDAFERLTDRTTLADALHARDRPDEARVFFVEAERMQVERQSRFPLLYSLAGYRYGDLLLTLGEAAEARRRAEQCFAWRLPSDSLLDVALYHLLLGRALLAAARDAVDLAPAAASLDAAVTKLREAGTQHHLPRGLLARAALHRARGDHDRARRDLAEAHTLAERGAMRLYLADAHLEAARLHLATGDRAAAGADYEAAARLVADTGYHRRDPELRALAAELLKN